MRAYITSFGNPHQWGSSLASHGGKASLTSQVRLNSSMEFRSSFRKITDHGIGYLAKVLAVSVHREQGGMINGLRSLQP